MTAPSTTEQLEALRRKWLAARALHDRLRRERLAIAREELAARTAHRDLAREFGRALGMTPAFDWPRRY